MSPTPPPSSGSTSSKRTILTNLVALTIVVIVLVFLALFTFSKDVTLEATCETLPIPARLTVDLVNPGTTVIATVEALAFNGDARAATILFDPRGKGQLAPVGSKAFQLTANAGADQSRSGLRIRQFKDPFGSKTQLELSPAAFLKSTGSPGDAPRLLVEGVDPGGAKLTISAMQMDIDGNDYVLSGLAKQDGTYKAFDAEIQSGGLILQPGPQPQAEVTLTFQKNSGPLSLPLEAQTGVTSSPIRLAFGGCLGAKVRMDGKNVEGLTPDARSDFEILSDSGKFDELSIVGDPKESRAPTLHIKATALTKSLTQNRRNVVPNLIQETTADPFATRNLWALPLAGVAWLIFEILRRVASKVLDATLGK